MQLYLTAMRPEVQRLTLELRPVVDVQMLRIAPLDSDRVQRGHDPVSREAGVDLNGQRFPRTRIQHGQRPKRGTGRQRVAHEIHRPPVIGFTRHRQGPAAAT